MARRWMMIAGAGTLVVIVIAAAVLLGRPSAPSQNTTDTTAIGLSGSSSMRSDAVSSAGSVTTDPSGSRAGATSSGRATSKATTGTASSRLGQARLDPLRPFPEMPASALQAEEVKDPIAKGDALPPLATAPADTISALELGQVPDGAAYRMTLRPYGFGPDSAFGTRIAIRIGAATPLGSAPKLPRIVNANVLVVVDTTNGGAIHSGGSYTADLQFRSDGVRLLPIMSRVAAER